VGVERLCFPGKYVEVPLFLPFEKACVFSRDGGRREKVCSIFFFSPSILLICLLFEFFFLFGWLFFFFFYLAHAQMKLDSASNTPVNPMATDDPTLEYDSDSYSSVKIMNTSVDSGSAHSVESDDPLTLRQ